MTSASALAQRLTFLARVVRREMDWLSLTDATLFTPDFTLDTVRSLGDKAALAEKIDAFVSRFGRLQDSVGDKMLPLWREALGETPGAAVDNLDRAERLGLLTSTALWLQLRKLRNQMVHDYIEDPTVLHGALQQAHQHVTTLTSFAGAILSDLERREIIPQPADPA
ncbi:hypothetical protein AB4090_14645 [Acidithiobacillus sp. IBUN Pt1247-S3]|uniref:hypothetical protein n=1 Tax=Acidithiobacillus sp. IBUN Pt1247-S3 TaxID=3166642 RepID=UPI0034E56653